MPREDYPSRPTFVDRHEIDDEVNMAVEKMDRDPSGDDSPNSGSDLPYPNASHDRRLHEPVAAEEEARPFVPYCKKNMTLQTNWPLYLQRNALREYFAEFFGTFILISFGNGVVATKQFQAENYEFTRDAAGNVIDYQLIDNNAYQSNASYLCVVFGWGMGLTMALYVSGKISGGHVNPAVTLTNAFFGNLPWIKVPFYILCQILGAMLGAGCVYGLFRPFFTKRREIVKLDQERKGSTVTDTDVLGGIFCTYPVREWYGNMFCFWSELFNTMLMQMSICGAGDEEQIPIKKNARARRRTSLKLRLYQQKKEAARRQQHSINGRSHDDDDLNDNDFNLIEEVLANEYNSGGNFFMTSKPIAVGLVVFVIGIATGWCSGYALNPARDLGPRMVSAMIFRSSDPFTKSSHYFWVPMFVPILGCMLGQFLYVVFICPERVPAAPEEDEFEEKQLYLAHHASPNSGSTVNSSRVGNSYVTTQAELPDHINLDG